MSAVRPKVRCGVMITSDNVSGFQVRVLRSPLALDSAELPAL